MACGQYCIRERPDHANRAMDVGWFVHLQLAGAFALVSCVVVVIVVVGLFVGCHHGKAAAAIVEGGKLSDR